MPVPVTDLIENASLGFVFASPRKGLSVVLLRILLLQSVAR